MVNGVDRQPATAIMSEWKASTVVPDMGGDSFL
ncbi:hypothetical protein CCACVL1_18197 [Corchorus capsularis]|uniref:Uncharacterized protein n=1 Tax=Corchorus capsularis TaxID=210143 RepID=A0A1R3HMK1_COCAP|nr:hypothetical protein CCACVL1_18197 [Corchorus capsularis]